MAKLPKRWEPYSAIGERIEGTRFVSFKVPLNDNLSSKVSEELRFTPATLVQTIEDRGQKLALVIDLTNTDRYYNKKDILEQGIKYEKIYTEGHRVPKDKIVQQFFSAVEQVLQESNEDDDLIGVHCTHGVNRTGYLVCRYMVEKLSIDPEIAIAAFTKARGHPIERENYLQDLRLRKDGGPGLEEEDAEDWNGWNGYHSDRVDHRHYDRPSRFDHYESSNGRRPHYWQDQDSYDYTRGDHSSRYNWTNGHSYVRDRSPHNEYDYESSRTRDSYNDYSDRKYRHPDRQTNHPNSHRYDEDRDRHYRYVTFSEDY